MAYKSIALCLIALLTSSFSNAGEANLSWTPPTQNEDGTPLTDLASYEIWHGCNQSGVYDTVEIVLTPATSHTVLGLPDTGTCYFAAKATNAQGESSQFSGEVSRDMDQQGIPGPVTDTKITWQESQVMTTPVIETGDIFDSGNNTPDTTPPMGHQAYGNGDFIVQFLVSDSNKAITIPATGPNGETRNIIGNGDVGGSGGPQIAAMWFVGTGSHAEGTQDWAIASPGESWMGRSIIVPAGEFDSANPVDSVSAVSGSLSGTDAETPSWFTSTADGRVVVGVGVDTRAFSSAATGWTALNIEDIGAVSAAITLRDAATTADETIASVNHTISASDSKSLLGLVINAPVAGREIGQVTEIDLVQAFGKTKSRAFGLVAESDVSQSLNKSKSKATGLIAETDTTQAFSKSKLRAFGLSAEVDAVFPMSLGGQEVPIGLLLEADLAQAIASAKQRSIGLNSESDIAQGIAKSKLKAFGLATELDLAQVFGRSKARSLELLTEADLAQVFNKAKNRTIGFVTESDQIFSMSPSGAILLGLVTETDIANVFAKAKQKPIGFVTEADLAQVFGTSKARQIGLAAELDLPFALASAKALAIGLVNETDISLTMSADRALHLGFVTETDLAFAYSRAKASGLGIVTETDVVFAMTASGPSVILVTNVVSRDVTFQLVLQRDARFAEKVLRDAAFAQTINRDVEF